MQSDAPRPIVQPFDQGTVKNMAEPGFDGVVALGQACLEHLPLFDVPRTAVDLRQARVLERAGIRHG